MSHEYCEEGTQELRGIVVGSRRQTPERILKLYLSEGYYHLIPWNSDILNSADHPWGLPNPKQPPTSEELVQEKKALASARSHCRQPASI